MAFIFTFVILALINAASARLSAVVPRLLGIRFPLSQARFAYGDFSQYHIRPPRLNPHHSPKRRPPARELVQFDRDPWRWRPGKDKVVVKNIPSDIIETPTDDTLFNKAVLFEVCRKALVTIVDIIDVKRIDASTVHLFPNDMSPALKLAVAFDTLGFPPSALPISNDINIEFHNPDAKCCSFCDHELHTVAQEQKEEKVQIAPHSNFCSNCFSPVVPGPPKWDDRSVIAVIEVGADGPVRSHVRPNAHGVYAQLMQCFISFKQPIVRFIDDGKTPSEEIESEIRKFIDDATIANMDRMYDLIRRERNLRHGGMIKRKPTFLKKQFVVAQEGRIHSAIYMTPLQAAIQIIRSPGLVNVLVRHGAVITNGDIAMARDEGLPKIADYLRTKRDIQVGKQNEILDE